VLINPPTGNVLIDDAVLIDDTVLIEAAPSPAVDAVPSPAATLEVL
jgi:hypothetical protein